MTDIWVHRYISTACLHATFEGRDELHRQCRNSCKYVREDAPPEYCQCSCHPQGELKASPVSWVDQARGIALRLIAACETAGVDLAAVDRHLARAIREDAALFWARGEEQPPGEWRDTSGDR